MRNSLITFIFVTAATAAMVSCVKETGIIESEKSSGAKGITIHAVTGIDTKTYIEDGDIPVVKWSADDQVVVFESVGDALAGAAYSSSTTIDDAGKASFTTELEWDAEGSPYKYSAVYPSSAVFKADGKWVLLMPSEQTLQGNNFSTDSDILYSEVEDYGDTRVADDDEVMFRMNRLGTVVRLTLKGIKAGEKIQQIIMEAPVYMSGTIAYDPTTGTVDPESAFDYVPSNIITLNVNGLEATGADVVWFRVMAERDWGEAGDELAFKVTTDKNTYSKEIASCPVMKFKDGGVTKFGVDLSNSLAEPYTVPYFEGFEEGAIDWTFIDADGDGYNWAVYADTPNSGKNSMESDSYINGVGGVEPDNWAFTPPVQLTSGNYLSFYVRAGSTYYAAEHYAVYLAEDTPFGDVTELMPETEFPQGNYAELGNDGIYQRYVIKIPEAFDNKVVCIGFRHFNCYDQYWFCLDDVEITEGDPTIVDAVYGDYLGDWAYGSKVYSIEQKDEGESYYISGLKGQGDYTVEATFENGSLVLPEQQLYSSEGTEIWLQGSDGSYPDYPEGSSSTIFKGVYDKNTNQINIKRQNGFELYVVFTYNDGELDMYNYYYDNIPTALVPYVPDTAVYIYQEGFEDYNNDWTLIDADGDGFNWKAVDNHHSYEGDYAFTSASYDNDYGALTPDNWAFTPAITLTSDNYLSFWIGAQDPDWPEEHYAVYITDTAPTASNLSNCTLLLEQTFPDGTPANQDDYYQRHIIKIHDSYAGKTVYIGFRHFGCTDMYYLNLDNVAVSEGDPVANAVIARKENKPIVTTRVMDKKPAKAAAAKKQIVGLRKIR